MAEKKFPLSAEARRALIDPRHKTLSIRRQCDLLDLPRSTFYYLPATESKENLRLMRLLDKQYLKTPFWGSRNMTTWFCQQGYAINRKRVQRLMRLMGLEGLALRPTTTKPAPGHRVVHEPGGSSGGQGEHGWPRSLPGQRVRGALVADGEV